MFSQLISLISMKCSSDKGCFNVAGIIGLRMETLRTQDWTESSYRNNVYNATFGLKIRLEHGYAVEYTYFH